MRRIVGVTTNKVNQVYFYVTNKLRSLACRKREGSAEIVILLLVIVVGVGLVALFKTQITSLLNTIFTKVTSEVTNSLIKEPTIN